MISNSDNIIDSRDVIKRIEELREERADLVTAQEDATAVLDALDEVGDADVREDATSFEAIAVQNLQNWDADNAEELKALEALQAEAEDYCPDWRHGATLIHDDHFETYAEELADDIGAIDKNARWPCDCIDWARAARELQMDYTPVEFDGVTYWMQQS